MTDPLRVTINTLSVTEANEGIRTLLTRLVRALPRVDRANRYRLVCSRANIDLFGEVEGVERLLLEDPRRRPLTRIWRDQVTVPLLTRRDTDVLVTPSSVGSVLAPVPQIVIVAAHLAIPSVRRQLPGPTLSALHRLYYGAVMRWSHRRASLVAPISAWLGERLVAETRLDPGKVVPLPLGVDIDRASTDAPPDDPECNVLFVGTLYPYKNAEMLIEAFAQAARRLPGDCRVVIVGRDPDGHQHARLASTARRLGVANVVDLLGKVTDEELDRHYRTATVLVLPSRAEGFGLPVLEAMALGVPVIAADATALPEVVGDAGLLVDPTSVDDLAEALVRVVNQPELRRHLSEAGRARAATLSWDRAARSLVDLIQRVRPSPHADEHIAADDS